MTRRKNSIVHSCSISSIDSVPPSPAVADPQDDLGALSAAIIGKRWLFLPPDTDPLRERESRWAGRHRAVVVKRARYGVEETIAKLRIAEVGTAHGQSTEEVVPIRNTDLLRHAIHSCAFEVNR